MAARRISKSRRSFLQSVPLVLAACRPASASAATLQQGGAVLPVPDVVTTDGMGAAQHIIGVSLPATERESARPIVVRNRENYDSIRNVAIAPEVEPAFSFRPPRPPDAAAAPAPRRLSRLPAAPLRKIASLEELAFEPVTVLAPLVESRQITSTDLTKMYLDRLKRHDPTLLCVVTLTEDLALDQAARADKEIRGGRYRGPLHGIPYGIKDLFAAQGAPTTWGARPYAHQVFDYDSTTVARLQEAGAVMVAKLATGELAIGDLWFRGRTRNPWNVERGASGSSAGPASATAAGLVGFAVGTETGGSIVSPASTCGVVGLRPTYGRVSRYGCMTLRWTLDKVGPMTRSVRDAALVLEAVYGPDGRDETVPNIAFNWNGQRDVENLRIGYVESELRGASGDRDAATRRPLYEAALDVYRKAGARLVPITLPALPASAVYAILNAEAGAMFDELTRSGAINELADKSPNSRANQLRATRFIPAVEYIRAQRVRTLLLHEMNAVFDEVDVFLSLSSSDSVTATNLTGHPAIVLPGGFVDGLPVGVMLTGRLWDEPTVLRAAAAFEAATTWHTAHPKLAES
ncbi:MAG TPA: amidase [Vicinamibacterales bacterium]|nr:amidase [Vicinamibacterales bacterium]